MQIKLGEKIKELRKHDGRKQEDLAAALGVTKQAVSRWEANGGCPDVEMLSAIANYFHITIDELFGYNSERQIKLQSYMEQADQICKSGDTARHAAFLRDAISEFPSAWQLQYRLANALVSMGYQKSEPHTIVAKGSDYFQYNTEHNAKNEYWKEAVSLFEEVLKQEIDDDSRTSAIFSLMWLYSWMGNQENAERTALSQPQEGLDTMLAVVHLYESIFYDGNYGMFHNDMCMLYLNCSSLAVHLQDTERTLRYYETALDHFLEFPKVQKDAQLTAPLVKNAKDYQPSIVKLDREWFEEHMQAFPTECAEAIKNNPRYAAIFA